jgi:ABC-type antimicrobial peptide transport system permease subunit
VYLADSVAKSGYVVRVKDKEGGYFAGAFFKEFNRFLTPDVASPRFVTLDNMKEISTFGNKLTLVLFIIATLFLTIFAFIGIFGVFWLHSKKAFREYALRIALGATKKRLMLLVISESLFVTGFAMLPGLLLSLLIYDYASEQGIAVGVTVFTMLLFSVISAWYPAWKVSKVNPAEALQYE